MKEISQEIINVKGIDYTLFLNRKGLVAWEKYCEEELKKSQEIRKKYEGLFKNAELKDDANPFEGLENFNEEEMEQDKYAVSQTFRRFYWIVLYTNHKLTVSDANKWYDDAVEEYGEEQLYQLANQMIEDANKDKIEERNKPIKNLPALRPQK